MLSHSAQPIIVVTKCVPITTGGGSLIRIGATVRALARRRQVKVVLITHPADHPSADEMARLKASGLDFSTLAEADLVAAGRWRRLIADLAVMVSPRLANRMLPQFGHSVIDDHKGDLWFFKATLLEGRRIPSTDRVTVDLDDLEERTLHNRPTLPYLLHRFHLIAKRRRAIAIARVSLVCSDQDRQRVRRNAKIDVLPNTYLPSDRTDLVSVSRREPIVAMVGRMAYPPNREGAEWFAAECWPLIRAQVPTARCRLIGRGAHTLDRFAGNGLEIIDVVADPIDYLHDAAVSISPILRGSGTRLKILEAMTLGLPVVSTTVGAEGLTVTDGTDILLRDSPEAFAHAVVQLLTNPELADKIGRNGTAVFDALYSFDHFQDHIVRILNLPD